MRSRQSRLENLVTIVEADGHTKARDKQCINCKGFHHFAKMCTDPRRPKVRAKGRVNQIQDSPDSDTDQPLLGNVDEEYGLGRRF